MYKEPKKKEVCKIILQDHNSNGKTLTKIAYNHTRINSKLNENI